MRSRYEAKAQKELEADGYIVDNKAGGGRWMKNRDFWNLFDLVAIREDIPYIRWISIKGKAGIPSWHKIAVEKFHMPPNNVKEIWARSNSKSFYWHKIRISNLIPILDTSRSDTAVRSDGS